MVMELNVQSVTGITTVGTSFGVTNLVVLLVLHLDLMRGVIMHNTGLGTATSSLYYLTK